MSCSLSSISSGNLWAACSKAFFLTSSHVVEKLYEDALKHPKKSGKHFGVVLSLKIFF